MLEEKIDNLTAEIVKLRKAIESGGGATAPAGKAKAEGSDDAEKPKRGRPAKKTEPEHSADQVEKMIRKVSSEVGKPVAKKIISDHGAEDLADLLTKPDQFDSAYAKAEAALAAHDEAEDEDEDI